MKIKRYDFDYDGVVTNSISGEFVLYEDYEKLALLCKDMLPVFEAARPLVLSLERLKDAAGSIE